MIKLDIKTKQTMLDCINHKVDLNSLIVKKFVINFIHNFCDKNFFIFGSLSKFNLSNSFEQENWSFHIRTSFSVGNYISHYNAVIISSDIIYISANEDIAIIVQFLNLQTDCSSQLGCIVKKYNPLLK